MVLIVKNAKQEGLPAGYATKAGQAALNATQKQTVLNLGKQVGSSAPYIASPLSSTVTPTKVIGGANNAYPIAPIQGSNSPVGGNPLQGRKIDTTYNKFGKEAEMMQSKDPSYLDRRNDFLATNITDKGDTSDATIRNYLSQNEGYKTAAPEQQEATFQKIKGNVNNLTNWNSYLKNIETASGLQAGDTRKQLGEQGYRDFMKTYQTTPTENLADFQTMLTAQIAGNRQVGQYQGMEAGQQAAVASNLNPEDKIHLENYNTIQKLQGEGFDNQKIASILGKDLQYVNDISQGQIGKYAKLNPTQEAEVNKYLNLNKEQTDLQNSQSKRDLDLKHQQNLEDYNQTYAEQQKQNEIQAKNMSQLARMTGIGYSSTGQEGLDYVYQKGQQALSDLTKAYTRNDEAIHNQIKDISDNYVYNTKLYNMQSQDAIKNATNAFFNQRQTIRSKYGELSEASMKGMQDAANTFVKSVQDTNKRKVDRQDKLNQELEDRKIQLRELSLKEQQVEQGNWKESVDPITGEKSYFNSKTGQTMGGQGMYQTGETTNIGKNDWDMDIKMGQPIAAPVGGTVVAIHKNTPGTTDGNIQFQIKDDNGNIVTLNHLDPQTLYSGLSAGDRVNAGDVIGVGGNTGNVKDMNGNWLRKDGKVLNAKALAAGQGSHLDIRVVGKSGQDTKDYLQLEGGKMYKKMTPELQNASESLANYTTDLKSSSSIRGGATVRQAMMEAAKELNPKWSEQGYGWLKDVNSGKGTYGTTQTALNNALPHILQLEEAVKGLSNNDSTRLANSLGNAWNAKYGSDEYRVAFDTIKNIAGSEATKLITGKSNYSQAEGEEFLSSLSNISTPKELKAAIGELGKAMAVRANSLYGKADEYGIKQNFINDEVWDELRGSDLYSYYSKYDTNNTQSTEQKDTNTDPLGILTQ